MCTIVLLMLSACPRHSDVLSPCLPPVLSTITFAKCQYVCKLLLILKHVHFFHCLYLPTSHIWPWNTKKVSLTPRQLPFSEPSHNACSSFCFPVIIYLNILGAAGGGECLVRNLGLNALSNFRYADCLVLGPVWDPWLGLGPPRKRSPC